MEGIMKEGVRCSRLCLNCGGEMGVGSDGPMSKPYPMGLRLDIMGWSKGVCLKLKGKGF